MTTARETVLAAVKEFFTDQDVTAVDRWVAPDYEQHASIAPDGPEGLRGLLATLPEGFGYEGVRVIADGDLVALHGVYSGFGPGPVVGFDLFRVEDGKLTEHWDALTPAIADTVSGRSQTDGPTEIRDRELTEANRRLVTEFVERVLQGADHAAVADYLSTEQYHQHNPEIADGIDGLTAAAAAFGEEGRYPVYKTIHKVVAEGDFVLVQSEGEFGGPAAFWDLWRVAGGRIVEHWDIIVPVPAKLPHGNGLF